MIKLDFYDLYYVHKNGCTRKYIQLNEKEIVKKNIKYDKEIGEVEFEAYCPECGVLLYTFCWGHYE